MENQQEGHINSLSKDASIAFSYKEKRELYFFWAYYLVLLVITLSWTETDLIEPNKVFRTVYFLLFILPLFRYPNFTPGIIAVFVTIRLFSISEYGYLPSEAIYYLIITSGIYIYGLLSGQENSRNSSLLIILLILVLVSNLINFAQEFDFFVLLLTLIMLGKLVVDKSDIRLLELGFVLITLFLSVYAFVFFRDFFLTGSATDERLYWNDPNYLGSVLSIGIIISFYRFLDYPSLKLIHRILYLVVFIIGFIMLGLLSSRGAFATAIIPMLFILLRKSNSIFRIILFGLLIFGLVAFILTSSYFSFLLERFMDDSMSTGSNRTLVWEYSFRLFTSSNPVHLLFGGGGFSSYSLCGKAMGLPLASPHNNYLEILYDYGALGFLTYIILIVRWFRINFKSTLNLSILMAFLICSMTLSPLMYMPFWFVLLFFEKGYLIYEEN